MNATDILRIEAARAVFEDAQHAVSWYGQSFNTVFTLY